jgi:alpha-glucuronidase
MKLWLRQLKQDVPADLDTPCDLARFELESAMPGIPVELCERAAMGDAYTIDPMDGNSYRICGGSTGLLYGAYRLITDYLCGISVSSPVSSAPKYALRMINCWDNADG